MDGWTDGQTDQQRTPRWGVFIITGILGSCSRGHGHPPGDPHAPNSVTSVLGTPHGMHFSPGCCVLVSEFILFLTVSWETRWEAAGRRQCCCLGPQALDSESSTPVFIL